MTDTVPEPDGAPSSLATALARLRAGDWTGAHALVQEDESRAGCWAHGIVHLQEGDLANARYWYRRAARDWPEHADVETELAALMQHLEGTGT